MTTRQVVFASLGLIALLVLIYYGMTLVFSALTDLLGLIPVLILVLAALIMIAGDSYVNIKEGKKGIRKVLNKRVNWKIMDEGFHFKWPFIEDIDQVPIRRFTAPVVFSFTAADEPDEEETETVPNLTGEKDKKGGKKKRGAGAPVYIEGEVIYEPDLGVYEVDKKGNVILGRVLYGRTGDNPDEIKTDIVGFTKSTIEILGGKFTGTEFVSNAEILFNLINCYLRLSEPPHLSHCSNDGNPRCGIQGCKYGNVVGVESIFDFYDDHREWVIGLLGVEGKNIDDRSLIEVRNGINIIAFNFSGESGVHFSKDLTDALEEKAETRALKKSYMDRVGFAEKTKTSLSMSGREAWDTISETFNEGIVEKRIISLQSAGSNLPLINIGDSSSGNKNKKDG